MSILSVGKISTSKEEEKPPGEKNTGGFTLLELIVVLLIVGLISALAAPRLIGSLTRTHLRTSVQKITSALRYTRSQAVSEQIKYTAVFDFEKNGCFIKTEKKDPNADSFDAAEMEASATEGSSEAESYGKSYILPKNVKIEKGIIGEEEYESETFTFDFFPVGNSSGGRVILIDENENRFQIEVDPITGIVKMTEPDESDA